MTGRRAAAFGAAALAALGACHRAPGDRTSPAACAAVAEPLPASADTGLLPGTFEVTFVAATGARAGAAPVTARLVLRQQVPGLVALPGVADTGITVSQPVIGTADLDPAAVGGVAMGDLSAADSLQPGVAAYVTRRQNGDVTSLVMRLGAISNTRDQMPYDAGHFTLYVRRIERAGFAGGWTSSSGTGFPVQEASGYFCAVRMG